MSDAAKRVVIVFNMAYRSWRAGEQASFPRGMAEKLCAVEDKGTDKTLARMATRAELTGPGKDALDREQKIEIPAEPEAEAPAAEDKPRGRRGR